MIATGTDIKPVEVVFFMRNVRSRSFFEQMKGRGVRTISSTEFNAVTPDARNKDRFVIVDAVGVTETELSDAYSLDRQPTVSFDKVMDLVGMGSRDPDVLSSLASRLARLDRQLTPQDRQAIEAAAQGVSLETLVSGLVNAADPDAALEAAREATGQDEPSESAVAQARQQLLEAAAKPFASNPQLRQLLVDIRRSYEQTIDAVSIDAVIEAGFSDGQANIIVQSFQQFIEENRDEITALQVLYERPYRQRLSYADIKALADALQLLADRLVECEIVDSISSGRAKPAADRSWAIPTRPEWPVMSRHPGSPAARAAPPPGPPAAGAAGWCRGGGRRAAWSRRSPPLRGGWPAGPERQPVPGTERFPRPPGRSSTPGSGCGRCRSPPAPRPPSAGRRPRRPAAARPA